MLAIEYEVVGDCWLYTGPLNAHGYGRAVVDGKRWQLHRLVYQELVGPLRGSIFHRCNNHRCVRPSHLRPKHDKTKPERTEKNHCRNGHALIDENAYWQKDGRRRCKLCQSDSQMQWYRRKQAKLKADKIEEQ